MPIEKHEFQSPSGVKLAARYDRPDGEPRGYALFAHCFTCSKDFIAARRVAADLSRLGFAVLRFDFTGLGASGGEFGNTSFSSNVDDLVAAAAYMADRGEAPSILIGHSLGGAAVLAAASSIPSAKGVATIGAPADVAHVLHQFESDVETIDKEGQAEVTLAGRKFTISKSFVDVARGTKLEDAVGKLKRDLLVLHSPIDQTVGIANATKIFLAAKHPKSFVSLDTADHLLTKETDARYVAGIIAAWAGRFLPAEEPQGVEAIEHVRVTETRQGKFQNIIQAGKHRFFADEPESVGGLDTGPSPYDLLSASLGACTSMTLRMYADFKKVPLEVVSVDVSHNKIHSDDCADCNDELKAKSAKIDNFERTITVSGELDEKTRQKLLEIADKCPVHKTLEGGAHVSTTIGQA